MRSCTYLCGPYIQQFKELYGNYITTAHTYRPCRTCCCFGQFGSSRDTRSHDRVLGASTVSSAYWCLLRLSVEGRADTIQVGVSSAERSGFVWFLSVLTTVGNAGDPSECNLSHGGELISDVTLAPALIRLSATWGYSSPNI